MINLGQAFMPIVQVVLPILNSFMKALNSVISTFAVFMKSIFGIETTINGGGTGSIGGISSSAKKMGDDFGGYSPSLDKASGSARGLGKDINNAGKEAKKLQGFLTGFDELNTVKKMDTGSTSGSGGGIGSGGIGDIGGIGGDIDFSGGIGEQMEEVESKLNPTIERIRKAFDNIGEAWGRVVEACKYFWESLKEFLSGFSFLIDPVIDLLGFVGTVLVDSLGLLVGFAGWVLDIVGMFLKWEPIANTLDLIGESLSWVIELLQGLWEGLMTGDWSGFVNTWKREWDKAKANWDKLWADAKKLFFDTWDKIKAYFAPIGDWFKRQWELIKADVKRLTDIVKSWFKDWNDNVRRWFGEWKQIFADIWANIKNGVSSLINYGKTKFSEWKTNITNLFSGLGAWFKNIWTSIENGINTLKNNCKNIASTMWNNIKSPFVSAYSWFKSNVVDKITNAFKSMTKPIKSAFNSIIGSVNWVIGKINSAMTFTIPDWVPIVGGKGFSLNIPKVPMLAKGGIVDSATLAMIGERGKEAVVPLENNTQWLDIIANKLSANMGNTGVGQNAPTEVIINIGGKQLGRYAIDSINQLQRQAGKQLIEIY